VNPQLISTIGLNAVSTIMVLTLVAIGLVIIFGFMGVINLAHGAFFTLGTYVAWIVSIEWGVSFWISLILAPIMVGLVALLIERLVIKHLYERLLDSILATWGIAIVIREGIKMTVGEESKQVVNPLAFSVSLGSVSYPAYRLFLIAFGLAIIGAVFLVFYRTNFGIRLRAVIQNRQMSSLLGVDEKRMYQFAFSFGGGLAGLAGAAVAPITTVSPNVGLSYLVDSFLIVILGGTATLSGVLPAAIVIGGLSNLLSYAMQGVYADSLVIFIVIVLIIIRPEGVFRRS